MKKFNNLNSKGIPVIIAILVLISCLSCENPLEEWFVSHGGDVEQVFQEGVFTDAQGRMHITQFGITWKFDQEYTWGQFANGDYWVVGPVNITAIYPLSRTVAERTKNGSMINPVAGTFDQGYDSSTMHATYVESLNVALNVSDSNALTLPGGTSLISSISRPEPGLRPQIQGASILTVLSSSAPAGSFRPPYCGTDKTIRFNKADLDYSLLAKLDPVADTPDMATVERLFERPWLDHVKDWVADYLRPVDNVAHYCRELSRDMGIGALMLHLNFTDAQKETLLVRFVQLGIDNFGVIQNGGRENFINNGGANQGKKWPILFAGIVLNDAQMKNIGQKSGDYLYTTGYGPGSVPPDYIHFQEDDQTFYVTADDVALESAVNVYHGVTFYGHYYPGDYVDYPEYTAGDIGLAEWGIRHATNPLLDGNIWMEARYRVVTGICWSGFVLAARIMESGSSAKTLWNHNVLFDYQDRYMAVTAESSMTPDWRSSVPGMEAIWATHPGYRQLGYGFIENMWDQYRDDF